MIRPSILLVEDNPITRKMLRVALESDGHSVADAADGRHALELVDVHMPTLLVLDYMLPDIDGLELLKEIRRRANAPELPALIVTGMVTRLEDLSARAGPGAQVLPKPVEPSWLLEFVRAHLAPQGIRGAGKRLLLVDDEPLNLKLGIAHLMGDGYQVEMASGGSEALKKALARPPDAIISDVLMPGMDGFAFCWEARRHPDLAAIPIVLVSMVYAEEADQELATKVGANALVLRSPDYREATEVMERNLAKSVAPPPPLGAAEFAALHAERIRIQLERQTSRNDLLWRQASIQATALSVARGLSEVLAQPRDVRHVVGSTLIHCLDAVGLSSGLLYLIGQDGDPRLQAQFGLSAATRAEAERCFGHPELLRGIARSGRPAAYLERARAGDEAAWNLLEHLGQPSGLFVPFAVAGIGSGILVLASDSYDLSETPWLTFARSVAAQFGQTMALGDSLARLAASESRHRALMRQANDAILVLDPRGRVLDANRMAESLLRRQAGEIIGSRFEDLTVQEEREDAGRFREALLHNGPMRPESRSFLRGDGTPVPVELSGTCVHADDGIEAPVLLAVLRDVTESKRAAEAVRQAQERLEHVVASSPAVLYLLRPEGEGFVVEWVSKNIERLLGYTAEEAYPLEWWPSHIHPDERERVLSELPVLLSDGYLTQEYRFRDKHGDYRWLRAELRLLRDASGKPVEAVGSWSDVTTWKEAELRLKDSE